FLAKGANELLGVDRSHATDHAGRQVFFDAVGRSRRRCAQEPRLELLAVGAVVDPFAGGRDPLAGGNGGGMANHGHDVTMPTRLSTHDPKPFLGVVVGFSLDEACQHLAVGWFGLDFHESRCSIGRVALATCPRWQQHMCARHKTSVDNDFQDTNTCCPTLLQYRTTNRSTASRGSARAANGRWGSSASMASPMTRRRRTGSAL